MPVAIERAGISEVLAVGGHAGRLSIWAKKRGEGWKEAASSDAHPLASGGLKDVAWCPNLCRSYEVVATCGAGARLWRVDLGASGEAGGGSAGMLVSAPGGGSGYGGKEQGGSIQLRLLREIVMCTDEVCPVWRCSWSLTGTALALSPEGAEVSVWKATASDEWSRECDIDVGA